MSKTHFHAHVAQNDAELKAAYQLRLNVFQLEQGYNEEHEFDTLDTIAAPFVLLDAQNAVQGVLRLLPYPLPIAADDFLPSDVVDKEILVGGGRTVLEMAEAFAAMQQVRQRTERGVILSGAKLGRLAISKQLRGQGCGSILVRAAEAWLAAALVKAPAAEKAQHVEAVVQLSSQVIAKAFYESLGYAPEGEVYLEEGQPHIRYTKRIQVRG
ncbi:hypothetical protein MVES1_000553 [Malassezia vespertilionis]|uniref:N-acetyltransferase domain-containing protein n=1 Tax=Malassezia vespertilionis TaxID=2020962 RepID=A0A2N1JH18_9BASI|nr:uncharacterized protein MVES1_000553 [Malassezia vespertilionis]PKI85851.1 hypothetical protein MVES_000510 [Malassezia vespertilionis]WFD05225.1 hypothetical protein MVES1_000553 [Malassezia vespertilionis]